MTNQTVLVEMINNSNTYGIAGFGIVTMLVLYKFFPKRLKLKHSLTQLTAFTFTVFSTVSLVIASLIFNTNSHTIYKQEKITEENARDVLTAVEIAVASKDVEGLVNNFDDHIKIILEPENGSPKILTKFEYKAFAVKAFFLPSSYELIRLSNKMEVSSDGSKAITTTLIHEHATIGLFVSDNLSRQITTIELRGGKPVITSVLAKTLHSDLHRTKNTPTAKAELKYVAVK